MLKKIKMLSVIKDNKDESVILFCGKSRGEDSSHLWTQEESQRVPYGGKKGQHGVNGQGKLKFTKEFLEKKKKEANKKGKRKMSMAQLQLLVK